RRSAGEFGDTPIESRTLARPAGVGHVPTSKDSKPPRRRGGRGVFSGLWRGHHRRGSARKPKKPPRTPRLRGGSGSVSWRQRGAVSYGQGRRRRGAVKVFPAPMSAVPP